MTKQNSKTKMLKETDLPELTTGKTHLIFAVSPE
jgi:hypothetical protein